MLMSLLSLLAGFYFAPDESSGGSGDSGEPGTGPGDQNRGNEPSPAPAPAQATTGTAPGDNGGNPGEGDKEVEADLPRTKEALDRRVEKAKRAGMRDILTALGFEDLEAPEALQAAQAELKGLVEFARQQREAALSAEERVEGHIQALTQRAERAEARATRVEQERDRAIAERDDARATLVRKTRHDAILRAAGSAKHPEDVVTWAEGNKPDLVAQVLNEDGSVNEDAVKDILIECARARRDWFAGPGVGVPSNHDGRPPASFTELEKRDGAGPAGGAASRPLSQPGGARTKQWLT